ncbi:hypothetical protein N7466_002181 [Penicillium verhagenii]|uniref:uncharacterized protein n=1 Tax=Penicillium verhagenii TaxID=1562060 RepID=UPI0025454544|nr:uncharacterized protein N7466_002181 [Penicillium verhagenii]KAJ5939047.1 hypothetical protein N7466_002181 [Penicillium verhagenii]
MNCPKPHTAWGLEAEETRAILAPLDPSTMHETRLRRFMDSSLVSATGGGIPRRDILAGRWTP